MKNLSTLRIILPIVVLVSIVNFAAQGVWRRISCGIQAQEYFRDSQNQYRDRVVAACLDLGHVTTAIALLEVTNANQPTGDEDNLSAVKKQLVAIQIDVEEIKSEVNQSVASDLKWQTYVEKQFVNIDNQLFRLKGF